ncbi:MAG: hypothetical protein ACI91O_000939 [Candidatus Poriferisodalaceae bacterium]|jgi:hypothetical protein
MASIRKTTAYAGLAAIGILAYTAATGAVSLVDAAWRATAVLLVVIVAQIMLPRLVTVFADTLD